MNTTTKTRKPKTFTDVQGDVWTVAVNVGTAKRVKDNTAVDLLDACRGDKNSLDLLVKDEFAFASVLYWLCKTEADARGIDEYEFAERLADLEILDQSSEAVVEALIDFFPSQSRDALHLLNKKITNKVAAPT